MPNISKENLTSVLKERIIDSILRSELNIEEIPDDVERRLYESILEVVDDFVDPVTICKGLFSKCIPSKK